MPRRTVVTLALLASLALLDACAEALPSSAPTTRVPDESQPGWFHVTMRSAGIAFALPLGRVEDLHEFSDADAFQTFLGFEPDRERTGPRYAHFAAARVHDATYTVWVGAARFWAAGDRFYAASVRVTNAAAFPRVDATRFLESFEMLDRT